MDIQKAVLKQLFLSQWTGSLEALLLGLTPQLKDCQKLSVFLLCHCSCGHCGASRSKEAATVLLSHLHSTKCPEERRKDRAKRALCLFHLIKESHFPTTFLYILLVNTGSYSSVRTVPGMRFCGWFGCVRIHPPAPRAGHTATRISWECVEKKDRAASSFLGGLGCAEATVGGGSKTHSFWQLMDPGVRLPRVKSDSATLCWQCDRRQII